jgi:RNA polymerase sigma-70 factor (ECF subfamily)
LDNGASSYRRFLDGDESAFDAILKEYFDGLVFFINRYVQDIHASEDIAIDAFSELIANKSGYNFKVSLKTYLYMLGRSRALNYIKRRKLIGFIDISEAERIADEKQIEQAVIKDERWRIINSAMAQLPDDMRIAVHLVYFEDMTYEQTARIMKKTAKQVDNLLYRAKNRLRIILGKDGEQLL